MVRHRHLLVKMQLPNKWTIIFSLLLCVMGFSFIIFSSPVLKFLICANLVLTPRSNVYELWKHFPTPVPMDFYFFNWTNPDEIYNKNAKPQFKEVGPYKFVMDLAKTNVTWNDNGTVTYQMQRYWYHNKENNSGNLQDEITFINVVSLGAAHVARTWSYMVRKGLSLTFSQLAPTISITHTVDELLFSGYPDMVAKIAKTLPFFAKTEIPPFDRFGWFYQRNGSDFFAGVNNVGTGLNSTFGKIYNWNYQNVTPYFQGRCAELDASTGENFEPEVLGQYIKIFSSDLCRSIILQYVGDTEVDGIIGRKYIIGDYMLDNGTIYKDHKCSCNGDCLPSGIFNVSSCRYGSPAFASLPHFYKADSYYNNLIEGSTPDKDKHEFYVIVEPHTGFPLQVRTRFQINMLLHSIPEVSVYEDVPTVLIPMMWFEQRIDIPHKEFSTLKQILNIAFVCTLVGILMNIAGLVFLLCKIPLQKRKPKHVEIKLKIENSGSVTPEEKHLL